ncbi:M15 family metallopeptidase [Polaribacter aestuariivivens]|uniref:M15 family metallopeptidase n=1 Tax=Polaribacter aestuariivivens TaxID=2304626 RepID=UPI003F498BC2
MSFIKLSVQSIFYLFLFTSFSNCKNHKEKIATNSVTVKTETDTISKFPNYLTKEYVLGLFDYIKNDDFVMVPKEISNKKVYLRKEVLTAFLAMRNAAEKENITFTVISGTRNFEHQKNIWNYKWNTKYKKLPHLERAKRILEFSAMPSTSRHHWGTEIDINSLSNSYFSFGKGLKEYNWLLKNASKFGFYQVYTSKEKGRTGYNEEKWHWSYAPLSKIYLEFYNENISINDITNFEGVEFAKQLNIISDYVNGVNMDLLK